MSLTIRPAGSYSITKPRFSGLREDFSALNQQEDQAQQAELHEKRMKALSAVVAKRDGIAVTGAEMLELIQQLTPDYLQALRSTAAHSVKDSLSGIIAGGVLAGASIPFIASEGIMGLCLGGLIMVATPVYQFATTFKARQFVPYNELDKLVPLYSRDFKVQDAWNALTTLDLVEVCPLKGNFEEHKEKKLVTFRVSELGLKMLAEFRAQMGTEKSPIQGDSLRLHSAKAVEPAPALKQQRIRRISVLLKQNASGLTGFEMLKEIQKELSKRWLYTKTFSQQEIATRFSIQAADLKGMPELEQAGWIVRHGGTDENPYFRLTPQSKELLKHSSIDALKSAGKITKEDYHGFFQLEIDSLRQQEAPYGPWLAGLEEKHKAAQEAVKAAELAHGEGQILENARRIETGREETLKKARHFDGKVSKAIQSAIANLIYQQELLELNADNAQLISLMKHPDQIVQGVRQQLQGALNDIQAEYGTSQALISPQEQVVRMRVAEKMAEQGHGDAISRAIENAQTQPDAASVNLPHHKVWQEPAGEALKSHTETGKP